MADAHVLATENLLLGAENKDAAGSAAGEALFISNGEPVTARAFCLAVWREFGHVPAFEIAVPERVAWCVGYVAEWVEWATGAPGTLCRGVVSDGCRDRYVCIDKARRVLGYEPRVGLEEGIRITCQVSKGLLLLVVVFAWCLQLTICSITRLRFRGDGKHSRHLIILHLQCPLESTTCFIIAPFEISIHRFSICLLPHYAYFSQAHEHDQSICCSLIVTHVGIT